MSDPREVHIAEQRIAEARMLAAEVAAFRDTLCAEGCTREEALGLTAMYLHQYCQVWHIIEADEE